MRALHLVATTCAALAGLPLAACGGDADPVKETPPVSPPAETWDLSRLPATGPVLEARTTPEGVRLLVLERGEGPEAVDATVMDVTYTGYLRTGQEFERSVMRFGGRYGPARSNLRPGIRAAVVGLKNGERRRALIPAAQGFGWESPRPTVPPGSDLILDLRAFFWQQLDLEEGTGPEVKPGQTVLVHYVGRFPEGRVFEESRKLGKGEPARLPLREGQVIDGWVRGVPGMKVGGRRRLHIPSSLAYGPAGQPSGGIPPHAHLVFTIELIEILPDTPVPPDRPR